MLLEPTKNKLKQWRVIEKSVNKCNFFSQMFWIITKWIKITEKQIWEDQITLVTFKQSHILLYQGLLFLTRSTCVIWSWTHDHTHANPTISYPGMIWYIWIEFGLFSTIIYIYIKHNTGQYFFHRELWFLHIHQYEWNWDKLALMKIHHLEWKISNFDCNFTEVCSYNPAMV